MRKQHTVRSTIKNDPWGSVIPVPNELGLPEVNEVPEQKPVMTRSPRVPRAINTNQQAVAANEPKTGKQKLTVHLASDLAEKNHIAEAHPEIVKRIEAIMAREHVRDPNWDPVEMPGVGVSTKAKKSPRKQQP